MRNRIFIVIFCAVCIACSAQSKWDQDLVIDYKMTDKDESLLNHIEVRKDTIFYEWIEKGKRYIKKAANEIELQNKLLKAMNDNKILKVKGHELTRSSVNMMITHKKGGKTKTIIFAQPIKQGSREEKFIKEFMEPILTKMFEQELKSFPK